MTTQHTPGPWTIESSEMMGSDIVSRSTNAFIACQVASGVDARLIAAAPKLLKALKQYREAIKDFAARRGISLQDGVICEADDLARAAIAEATGQEQ